MVSHTIVEAPSGETWSEAFDEGDPTAIDAAIARAHDDALRQLEAGNKSFVDTVDLEEESNLSLFDARHDENGSLMSFFLHQIINGVHQGLINADIANTFTKRLLAKLPSLITDKDCEGKIPVDLAASSNNCRGIIEAMFEHVVPDSEAAATINDAVATRKVGWSELLLNGGDSCLHTAIRKRKYDYAHYILGRVHDAKAEAKLLGHYGKMGLTPLHLVADYAACTRDQLKLAERIIDMYPESLSITSSLSNSTMYQDRNEPTTEIKEGISPYKYFLETKETLNKRPGRTGPGRTGSRPALVTRGPAEKMEELLRLSCMRYHGHDRARITKLLGTTVGYNTPSSFVIYMPSTRYACEPEG